MFWVCIVPTEYKFELNTNGSSLLLKVEKHPPQKNRILPAIGTMKDPIGLGKLSGKGGEEIEIKQV